MPNPNWVQVSAELREKLKTGEIVNSTVEELGQYLLSLPHISEMDIPASVKRDYTVLLRQMIQLKFTKDLAKEQAESARASAEASRLSDERSRGIARNALTVSKISVSASVIVGVAGVVLGLMTALRKPITTPLPVVMVSTNVVTLTNTVQQTNFVTVTNQVKAR